MEHGDAGALAVGGFEDAGEQALGLGQGAVAAGGGGGIDDDQPELTRVLAPGRADQIGSLARTAAQQCG